MPPSISALSLFVRRERRRGGFFAGILLLLCTSQFAQSDPPDLSISEIGWTTRLGTRLPLSTVVHEENGAAQPLGAFFDGHPVVLAFGYRPCADVCPMSRADLAALLQQLSAAEGPAVNVLYVSIDPADTAKDAQALHRSLMSHLRNAPRVAQVHALTSNAASLQQITRAAGLEMSYDAPSRSFAHPHGFLVLSPAGRITKLFPSLGVDAADVEAALADAAPRESGSARLTALPRLVRLALTGRLGTATRLGFETLLVLALLGACGGLRWLLHPATPPRALTPRARAWIVRFPRPHSHA